jgi:precorrin-6B methylase 2
MTSSYVLELTDSELARYLQMAETARREEAGLWARAGIGPGAVIADIGCGPGALAAALAGVVGPPGSVIAVDRDDVALAHARELLARRHLENVTVRQGDASATGIDPASVDVAVIRHVLAHNGGHEQEIVDHAASLVRANGSLLVVDVDLTAHRWVPEDPDLSELQQRYIELHRMRGNHPTIGLYLDRLLANSGLTVIEHRGWYSPFPWTAEPPPWIARDALVAAGIATGGDVERWAAALTRLDLSSDPPAIFVSMFAAIGRRSRTH